MAVIFTRDAAAPMSTAIVVDTINIATPFAFVAAMSIRFPIPAVTLASDSASVPMKAAQRVYTDPLKTG
ncbi:hypothetical protein [Burkholderia catarinensis]|uniref:hypothetical protein n=1 Tax=Burkholderia catarinensis TaxID=1108140 RepID=UPI0010081C80|nr:hypothetical protein [Burkholderia catarinensis]